jgi:hypothetical protein
VFNRRGPSCLPTGGQYRAAVAVKALTAWHDRDRRAGQRRGEVSPGTWEARKPPSERTGEG